MDNTATQEPGATHFAPRFTGEPLTWNVVQFPPKLATQLALAQAEYPELVKDRQGQTGNQKYWYLTLGAAQKVIRPVLTKHQIAVVQFPFRRPSTITMPDGTQTHGHVVGCTTIVAHDDEAISFELGFELTHADTKESGKAITYAQRYSYCAAVGIEAEDREGVNGDNERLKPSAGHKQRQANKSRAAAKAIATTKTPAALVNGARYTGVKIGTHDGNHFVENWLDLIKMIDVDFGDGPSSKQTIMFVPDGPYSGIPLPELKPEMLATAIKRLEDKGLDKLSERDHAYYAGCRYQEQLNEEKQERS